MVHIIILYIRLNIFDAECANLYKFKCERHVIDGIEGKCDITGLF